MTRLYMNPDGTVGVDSSGNPMAAPTQEEFEDCCCGRCQWCATTPRTLTLTIANWNSNSNGPVCVNGMEVSGWNADLNGVHVLNYDGGTSCSWSKEIAITPCTFTWHANADCTGAILTDIPYGNLAITTTKAYLSVVQFGANTAAVMLTFEAMTPPRFNIAGTGAIVSIGGNVCSDRFSATVPAITTWSSNVGWYYIQNCQPPYSPPCMMRYASLAIPRTAFDVTVNP